jgi:hypothetical protein
VEVLEMELDTRELQTAAVDATNLDITAPHVLKIEEIRRT